MKIVAVDDSRAFLAVLERAARAAGAELRGLSTWTELLKVLSHEPADAVVIDASMPILAGVQIVEVTRRHWPALPIILVSGEPSGVLDLQATSAGADAYLAKTEVPKQLMRTVEQAIRRRASASRRVRRPDSGAAPKPTSGARKAGPTSAAHRKPT
jgi:DNA-binding response OmpR family regulator